MGQTDTGAISIVRSELLGSIPSVILGVSTKQGGVSREPLGMNLSYKVGDDEESVARNRALFFGAMGISEERVAIPGQVHGTAVRVVSEPGRYPETDGIVTDQPGLYLAVTVADCVPIFLVDAKKGVIAAVHAGWRGTAGGILTGAVRLMAEELGCSPSVMKAYLGPSAESCCYEVGPEVAEQLPQASERRGGRLFLSLRKANSDQLRAAGLPSTAIESSTLCTICKSHLHSYRRDGAHSGRMMGVIGMREEARSRKQERVR